MPQDAQLPAWYNWAYALSETSLLLVSMLGVASIVLLATLCLVSYRGHPRRTLPSTLPPAFVTGIVLPVSVVIGLLVTDVWRKYSDAQDVVMMEAAHVADAARAIKRLPESAAHELDALLRTYVEEDVPRDWQAFQTHPLHLDTRSTLNELEFRTQALHRQLHDDIVAQSTLQVLIADLEALDALRKQRIHLSVGRIDNPRWRVLGILLFCSIALMGDVVYGQRRNFLVAAVLFTLSYGSLMYMLITHDRPYTGQTLVLPTPITEAYRHQLQAPRPP